MNSIQMKGAALIASAMLALTGCNSSDTTDTVNSPNPPSTPALTELEVTVDASYLLKGTKRTVINPGVNVLVASTGTLSDGSKTNVTHEVQWKLNDEDVALHQGTIHIPNDSSGVVTISSNHDSIESNVVSLNINSFPIESVSIVPNGQYHYQGSMQQYAAYGHYSDGTSADITPQVHWESSNNTSTVINEDGFAFSISSGSSDIVAKVEGVYSDPVSHVAEEEQVQTDSDVVGVVISNGHAVIEVENTFNYRAVAGFTNGDLRYVTDEVTWHSSDSLVASIEEGGQATGIKSGTTEISASLEDKVSDSGTLIVLGDAIHDSIAELFVSPDNATIAEGDSRRYVSRVIYHDGSTANVTDIVGWVSTNENVASMSSKGFATGVSQGSTQVYATLDGYEGKPVSLFVSNSAIDDITIEIDTHNMRVGTTKQLKAFAHNSDGTSEDITDIASWTAGNPSLLTVTNDGLASAHDAGFTTVYAALDGARSSSLPMYVNDSDILDLVLNPGKPIMEIGATVPAKVTVFYSDFSSEEVQDGVTWVSNNRDVVTVTSSGILQAQGTGTAEVTAMFEHAHSDQPIQVTVK
ncbi:Ig-like domain-containing protein [Vibrio kyushuensis]|uniref:Ig-like domain-containing protein n=1 Tax=Vibrio kyushuensis TaxID=2910249 RepID=UPI003D14B15F